MPKVRGPTLFSLVLFGLGPAALSLKVDNRRQRFRSHLLAHIPYFEVTGNQSGGGLRGHEDGALLIALHRTARPHCQYHEGQQI
jgi:hypothetical protein